MSSHFRIWVVGLALGILGGCTTYSPIVTKSDIPQQDRGYLLGRFTQMGDSKSVNMGIKVLQQDSKNNETVYYIEFMPQFPGNVVAIPVAPGRYQIVGFVFTAKNGFGANLTKGERLVDESKRVFINVEGGKLYYLGDFVGEAKATHMGSYIQQQWRISKVSYSPDDTVRTFFENNPSFRDMPVVK